MTDLVVATPVFLDLTFVGLESPPMLGEERFAAELLRSPGGGAITAVAAARLGMSAAVAAPLGDDVAGDIVRSMLAEEGVEWIASRPSPRTPTTVVMPFGGDRAMVTIDPGARASASDVAAREPRAVAASLDQLYVVPNGATAYVTCGDDDLRAYAGRPPAGLGGARALFVNQREALGLSGKDTAADAAASLAELAETVVVTLAAEGAMAFGNGDAMAAPGEAVQNPADTTGAGDLLTAAYIWADLHGAEPEARLQLGRAVRRPRRDDADGGRRRGRPGDAAPRGRRAGAHAPAPGPRLIASPVAGSKKCSCRWSTASSSSSRAQRDACRRSHAQNRARRSSASSVASSSDAASIAARVASVCTRGASIGKSRFVTPPSSSTRSGRTLIRGSLGGASAGVPEVGGANPEDDVARPVVQRRPCRQRQAEPGERDAAIAHPGLDHVHRRRPDERRDEEVRGVVEQRSAACRTAAGRRRAAPRPAGRASSPRPGRA